ncbi:MAG: hypothetical protein BWX88_05055 [Planctomycetes bacterium ADurb.Bin126]|nr:MAG: hypothetical protein BWX88_05055 [Planctomycetes bacterium ADurb.Bin126]
MTRRKPQTYEAQMNGKKVRVTVPQAIDEQVLFDALRDNLSPHAVAAIVAFLQPVRTNNSDVDRQVHWFAGELTKLIGGNEQQNRLAEELGL